MKSMIIEITGGIGVLIAIYLFVSNFKGTVAIIGALASPSIEMVQTLQGR
jgi:hypothetical protein